MTDDTTLDAATQRLLLRERLRRYAAAISGANSPASLEGTLAQISAEVTAEAIERKQNCAE